MSEAADIANALGARPTGHGWMARCVAHEDRVPSLSIAEGAGGKVLVKCHAGCAQSAVVNALRDRGLWPEPYAAGGLTVAQLAQAKGLPEALLRECGFSDEEIRSRPVVRMEYRDADGAITCVRYRGALAANGTDRRFWFRRGDKQELFGLWRLRAEPVIVVEGETDTLALWAAEFNAIGVPGAEAWRDGRFSPTLERCPTVYVHVEADAGGEKFRAAFERSRLRDRVRFFTIAPNAKDPCELRARDADGFRAAIEALLRAAQPAQSTASPTPLASEEPLPGTSDDELALRFSERHVQELRYVAAWDRWLLWDKYRWAHDTKRRVFDLARRLCRDVRDEQLKGLGLSEAQKKALRGRLGSANTVYAVVRLASSDPRHAVGVEQLDANAWVLNTPGGILDLRTGALRPHDPAELHTKVTAATPDGDCPLFRAVLERAQPSAEIRAYVQRLLGYGLTGSSREHVLPLWHGSGANSKGTIAHAFRRALGDYGLEIASETLMETHNERHPTELAVLCAARFVVASEVDAGRRWNESRVKRLTGGDPIAARFIGRDFFLFEPSHTLLIIGNNKPGLRSVDEAIRRRMHLLEFSLTVPTEQRDTKLGEKLEAEYGGILAWALAGCLEWQSTGLAPPERVQASTAAYLVGEDMLQAWIEEECLKCGQLTLTAAHRSYRQWCERNGAVVLGRNTFGDQLEARGFKRATDSHSKAAVFAGLSLPVRKDRRFPDDD